MSDPVEILARALTNELDSPRGPVTESDRKLARAVLSALEAAGYAVVPNERHYDERAAKMAEMRRNGMFFHEIGKQFGISDAAVQEALRKRGYPLKPEVKQKRILKRKGS